MEDVNLRSTADWQKLGQLYWFMHSGEYVVWECEACGDGADVRIGYNGAAGVLDNSHSCPGEPQDEHAARRVQYMRDHGRPVPSWH